MRSRDVHRLEELLALAREIRKGLDREAYQKPPFVDVTTKEAKIHASRLINWLDELAWMARQ